MQIYMTMDQVFAIFSYGAMMTWGIIYCKLYMKQRLSRLCNSCILGRKKYNFNDFKWMDVGIALYELDVIK
jgi:hypothetical protein